MRRIASVALSVLMALSLWLMTGSTANASSNSPPGSGTASTMASSYSGESAFTNATAGVVGLPFFLPDKVTCNATTLGPASMVYATISTTDGQNGSFTYNSAVSAGIAPSTPTFNGDVDSAINALRPEGYYQINTTLSTTAPTISPTSETLPVGGTVLAFGTSPPSSVISISSMKSLYSNMSAANLDMTNTLYDKFATGNNTSTSAASPPALSGTRSCLDVQMRASSTMSDSSSTGVSASAAASTTAVSSQLGPTLTE